MYVTWLIRIYDMMHWCMRQDSFVHRAWAHWCTWNDSLYVTWRIHVRETTRSYIWHDSLMYVKWLMRTIWHDALMHVTCIIHMYGIHYWCMWYDSFISYGMTHSYVWDDSFILITWRINVCERTHSYMWHVSWMYVTYLIHIYMTWLINAYDITRYCM